MIPLLTTKLFIPPRRPRDNVVDRSRLTDRLTATNGQRLTLVSAPAGFGKSTLLSEWIPHSERCVAWLSLDANDSDPLRFWAYVIAAVQLLQPDLGAGALALLQVPQSPPIETILTLLLNDVAAFPTRFVLVLDDYHLVEAPAIHAALTFLLDHLPPQMHVMITSRSDPPLPLARWRARRQLTEIRAADLRFMPAEAAAFLNHVMGLNLAADEIAALETRTEGWIAGLQLAALSMQGHDDVGGFIRSFTGSHAYIVDYLAEEVVQRQSAEMQSFLLQTSILDRMCGPLCDAVLGRTDSQATLETLQRSNLFVISLDDERRWYRYHHLFADVLRARLRATQREAVIALHQRASEWCEQNDLLIEAIHHAFAADGVDRAAHQRASDYAALDFLVTGDMGRASQAYPAELIESTRSACDLIGHFSAISTVGWAHVYQGQLREAARLFQIGLTEAAAAGLQHFFADMFYHIGLGAILYEWNQLDEAELHLEQGLRMAHGVSVEANGAAVGSTALARIRQARGDAAGALELLDRFAQVAHERRFAASLIARGEAMRACAADARQHRRRLAVGGGEREREVLPSLPLDSPITRSRPNW